MVVFISIEIVIFNINEIIIYSELTVSIINNGKQLNKLQNRLKDIIYVIINKKNMISYQILTLINI